MPSASNLSTLFRRSNFPKEEQTASKLNASGRRGDLDGSQMADRGTPPGKKGSERSRGFFYKARRLLIYRPNMIENNYLMPMDSANLKSVFDILGPHVKPEAAVDSSARDPPPRCHPGTRKQIGGKLNSWLTDEDRLWNMIWLRGPAGTGKSAVAQTFAEYAVEQGHFGAAFFFSRVNKRNNPRFVIPTLAYQLATYRSDYKALLIRQLVDNPLILTAALRVQFKKLIIEPFRGLVRNPQQSLLIVLDGLDECNGEDAQCELIRLVCEAAHEGNHTPFLWFICSRPEPHIVFTFSTLESSINCGRELLSLDAESRMDVDRYLREGLAEIHGKHQGGVATNMGRSWPSGADFSKISNAASGLFIFATTALKYIGDPEYADPEYQLRMFIAFIDKTQQLGTKSPWDSLDLLYTCILSDAPKHILPITLRILGFCILHQDLSAGKGRFIPDVHSVLVHCNFLRLEQGVFYSALRKLHAIMDIPPPEKAASSSLSFHHASFTDYLQDESRSGKYCIGGLRIYFDFAESCLYWATLRSDINDPGDGISSSSYAQNFTWIPSSDDLGPTHLGVAETAALSLSVACTLTESDRFSDLLSRIRRCRFTNFVAKDPLSFVEGLVAKLHWLGPREELGDDYTRAEVCNTVDTRLLDHLRLLVGPTTSLEPMEYPLDFNRIRGGEVHYFFLGHGSDSRIVCCSFNKNCRCYILGTERQPSERGVSQFRQHMEL